MDRFIEKVKSYSLVGLDTTIFIYHFEQNPNYSPLTSAILSNIEAGRPIGITSTITLLEISVKPLALGQPGIARKYEALLVNFPHLNIIDLDRDVIRQAARLRAEYRIRPPDALQISACILHGAKAFITNNRLLTRMKDKIDILILDDYQGIN